MKGSTPGQAYQTPNPTKRSLARSRWRPALLWALLIWLLLSIPTGILGAGKGGWLATHLPAWLLARIDKVVHAGLFLVLAGLLHRGPRSAATGPSPLAGLGRVLALSCTYGALTELYQHLFLPWRSGDLADLLADGLGASLYALAVVAGYGLRVLAGREPR